MPKTFDLIIKGGTLVNHDGAGVRDVGIIAEKIAEIGDLASASAGKTVDARGLHILPGVIDSQVHFREPGFPAKEDLESGSRAAVLGGVTAVFEMPNTRPLTTGAAELADKIARASGRMHCDFAFWVGGTHENVADIPQLERLPGAAGIKVFMGSSTGTLLVEDDAGVAAILAKTRRRAAFHSEDEFRLNERKALRVSDDPGSHPIWRDETSALTSTQRLLRIARDKHAAIHVLHVSTAEEIDLLAKNKDIASVEVTTHHLTFSAEDYPRLGTRVQMNPPVRAPRHRDHLWYGLAQGIVDVLGSDHAPHTIEEKSKAYPNSPSGMPGVQTLVPIMLDYVNAGRLSLERLVDLTSAGPARLFGIACKGRVAVGYDADLTLVDMKKEVTISDADMASRCGWTPYAGLRVKGWPIGTLVRGHIVVWDAEVVTPAQGAPVRFLAAL